MKWIHDSLDVVRPGRWVDLHVDMLDPDRRDFETWLPGLERMLVEGWTTLRAAGSPLTLAGCISLRDSKTPQGLDFTDLDRLLRAMDRTPPSLYLFAPGDEPWTSSGGVAAPGLPLHPSLAGAELFYLECFIPFGDPDDAPFRRSLWIAPPRRRE